MVKTIVFIVGWLVWLSNWWTQLGHPYIVTKYEAYSGLVKFAGIVKTFVHKEIIGMFIENPRRLIHFSNHNAPQTHSCE